MEFWRFFKKKKVVLAAGLAVFFFFFAWIAYFLLSLPDVSYLTAQNPKITALMEVRIKQAKKEEGDFG